MDTLRFDRATWVGVIAVIASTGCWAKVSETDQASLHSQDPSGAGGTASNVACPAGVPLPGDPCTGDQGECDYSTPCGTPHRASCVEGQWKLVYSPCAPTCPDSVPSEGSPCSFDALRCDWGDGCTAVHADCAGGTAGGGNRSYDGTWVVLGAAHDGVGACASFVSQPPGATKCPAALPSSGESCALADSTPCNYDNGCGSVTAASCRSTWDIRESQCLTQCPVRRPKTGDACSSPTLSGPLCTYGDGDTCWTSCMCTTSGIWACYESCSWNDGGTGWPSTATSGMIPDPWHRCDPGAWCPEAGSSCGMGSTRCTCTAAGWACE